MNQPIEQPVIENRIFTIRGKTVMLDMQRLLLMDACVLIDFIKTDSSIFKLFIQYVGEIHVVSPVVEEVKDIESTQALEKLGLYIIEPQSVYR